MCPASSARMAGTGLLTDQQSQCARSWESCNFLRSVTLVTFWPCLLHVQKFRNGFVSTFSHVQSSQFHAQPKKRGRYFPMLFWKDLVGYVGTPDTHTHTHTHREREKHCFQPVRLMNTGLCSCLGLLQQLQQGNVTMADGVLVLVPHKQTHAPCRTLEQATKLGSDLTKRGAINQWISILLPTACVSQAVHPSKVAWEGWSDKTTLLNKQVMGPRCDLHRSLELDDAHGQFMVGLKAQFFWPARPTVICAKLCPLGWVSPGGLRFLLTCSQRFAKLPMN